MQYHFPFRQFYQDLLVLSGDLYVPTQKDEKISCGGRIGIGFGIYRFRISGDGTRHYHALKSPLRDSHMQLSLTAAASKSKQVVGGG